MARIAQRDALGVLTKPRLLQVADALGIDFPAQALKADLIDAIASSPRASFPKILERLRRDELKAICRRVGVDDSGREKSKIADRILGRRPEGGRSTLRKVDLVEDVVEATGFLKGEAEVMVNATLDAMAESLTCGSPIEIRGFGSFRFRDRRARLGLNPATGATVRIPAKRVCYFKPGKSLLEAINGSTRRESSR